MDTLLSFSDQLILASTALEIKHAVPVGETIDIDTHVTDLHLFKGQVFITVRQDYSLGGATIAALTQVLRLKQPQ